MDCCKSFHEFLMSFSSFLPPSYESYTFFLTSLQSEARRSGMPPLWLSFDHEGRQRMGKRQSSRGRAMAEKERKENKNPGLSTFSLPSFFLSLSLHWTSNSFFLTHFNFHHSKQNSILRNLTMITGDSVQKRWANTGSKGAWRMGQDTRSKTFASFQPI